MKPSLAGMPSVNFLPLVARELRVRARKRGTYWLRCLWALAAALVAGSLMVAGFFVGPAKAGKTMFSTMAWMCWIFCLVEGFRNTADCLSEEKRDGTLGLLFLTDLRGYDVALGKFVGAALGASFAFLAAVPVLGLSMLQGGVTAGEFWRVALTLLDTLFFSLAAGLFVSAVSRRERRAWAGTVLLLLFFCAAIPVAAGAAGWVGAALLPASPWTVFSLAFESDYLRNPRGFWDAALVVHLLGWLWLALASVLLGRCWQEKVEVVSRSGRLLTRFGSTYGPILDRIFVGPKAWGGLRQPAEVASLDRAQSHQAAPEPLLMSGGSRRASLLAYNPVYWLALRVGRSVRLIWLLIIPVCVLGLVGVGASLGQSGRLLPLWLYGQGVHLVVSGWVAWEACHLLGGLRRSGMLELLLAVPLRQNEIVDGGELALRRLAFGPVALIAGLELAALITIGAYELAVSSGWNSAIELIVPTGLLGIALTLWVMDLLAVARVGMWLSLVSRHPAQAWVRTVLLVLIGPLLLTAMPGVVCCGVTAPFMLLAKNLLFISWAKNKLRTGFRAAVAGQYISRASG